MLNPGSFLKIILGIVKNKIEKCIFAIFLILPAICYIFSIKSIILKLATAVDEHDIYTGHSILFVFFLFGKYQDRRRVWPILIFKLKLEKSRKNEENHK